MIHEAWGDLNADGYADIALGTGRGIQATVVYGAVSFSPVLQINALPVQHTLLLNTGSCVAAAGDVNGDGFPDALFGNPYAQVVSVGGQQQYVGIISLLLGAQNIPKVVETNTYSERTFTIRGAGNELFGMKVRGVNDVNNDGFDDFLIAAPKAGEDQNGLTYLVLGSSRLCQPVEYALVIEGGTK